MLGASRSASRLTAGPAAGLAARLAAVAAVAVVGVSVAGCTAAASSAAPPASPTVGTSSAPPSATASTVATPTASSVASANATGAASSPAASASASSSTPATPTGPTACPTRSLSVKAGLQQGTAGSIYQVIDFTNISNGPCTLYGYPGVSLADGTPVTQVGAAASRTTGTAATLVTLSPGQTANALLRIVEAGNYSPSTCSPTATTYIQVYPPNQTTPTYLSYTSTGCASSSVNLLSVSVVTAGTGG
jgi:hypothetical protein